MIQAIRQQNTSIKVFNARDKYKARGYQASSKRERQSYQFTVQANNEKTLRRSSVQRQRKLKRLNNKYSMKPQQIVPEIVEENKGFINIFKIPFEKFQSIPDRNKLILANSVAFVICSMDKVNMSVAIIPMSKDFGWNSSIAGLVQSSFFWGYLLCQIPGGFITQKFGGKKIMPSGVGVWSVATALVPFLAGTIPGLCFSRSLVGLGEGVAPSAAVDMVSKTMPKSERSRSISFIFNGLNVGSIIGLILAPAIIKSMGWESVFVIFGLGGVAWTVWFTILSGNMDFDLMNQEAQQVEETEEQRVRTISTRSQRAAANKESLSPSNSQKQLQPSSTFKLSRSKSQEMAAAEAKKDGVPFRAFLRSTPVRALMFTHFCHNWFHYTMLAWLPTYFSETLGMDIMHAAQVSLFPPITSFFIASVVGQIADGLISRGMKVGHVRKLCQTVAFASPALLLSYLAFSGEDLNVVYSVGLVALSLGISSFSLVGLYCTHGDMSPKFSSVLLGLTNTSGAVPGIFGVVFVGQILDLTHSWQISLFAPCIFFFIAGAIVYGKYSSSDLQDFSNDKPFWFENFFKRKLNLEEQ